MTRATLHRYPPGRRSRRASGADRSLLLDSNYRVLRAALVPVETVQARANYVAHVNAWRLVLRDSVWDEAGVQDVTSELRAAEGEI